MRRITIVLCLAAGLVALAAPPAGAQSLAPASAVFPPTPLRTDSAPIAFTLTGATVMGFPVQSSIGTQNTGDSATSSSGFKQTNNCPTFIGDGQSCTINVVFFPFDLHPATVTGTLTAAGKTAALSGTGYLKGSGGKKKCKKKKKKRSTAAAKKCKKK